MTWIIDPEVSIGLSSYTSQTLNGVSITYGRTNVWEQPRAGYAQVQIKNDNNSIFSPALGDQLIVTVDNSTGTPITLFTGKVNSIASQVQASGTNATVVIHTVTALAPMSEMARVITHTSAWPKEYDSTRLNTILTDSGVTIDTVDSPGVYQFTAAAANPNDCYTKASYYAQMAFGYIYETTNGKVGYANESRRTVYANNYGYFSIPSNIILASSVSASINNNNLLNDLRLEYKASAVVTATSASSIASYGPAEGDIVTELEDATEAQNQANKYILLRSVPLPVLNSFTVQLDASTITAATRNTLLSTYMGKPVELAALPNGIHNGTFRGFVEGWNFNISENQASLTMNVSENSLSLSPSRWQDLNATLIWNDIDPTIEWATYE